MAKINIQFHAMPSEIIDFVQKCVIEDNLYIAVMKFFPIFNIMLVTNFDYLKNPGDIDRLSLCESEPNIIANSAIEFSKKNPDCLSLTLGKYDGESLNESLLAAQTENRAALTLWKRIVKKFYAISFQGCWVVNPKTGAKSYNKSHRYTEAAKRLYDGGVKIKPIAGWNYFLLNE